MPSPPYDLIDIISTIRKKKRLIILISLVAAVLGGIFHTIRPAKYKADARFLVNNPLYGDRNTLFRSIETRYVDYFGGDDDLDRVTSLLNSDTVRDRIIRNCQFQDVYKADINAPKTHAYLMSIFDKNFNLKRTEYKDMVVSYVAYDPQTAANVANMSVKVLEETYRSYYSAMKQSMVNAIVEKIKTLDTTINQLTDSLANMRDQFGIYNIMSPSRQNIITSDIKSNGKGTGKALEQIQNVESIKDQLVSDRAHYISLNNEFEVSKNSDITYIKLISRALPPSNPTGFSLMMTAGVSFLLALFFSICLALMMDYYQLLMATER